MPGDQRQGQPKMDAAAHVAVGVSFSRNPVHLVFRGDLRQEGVVENIRCNVGHLRDQKNDQRAIDVPGAAEVQQQREERAAVGEEEQEAFLGCGEVRNRSQDRRRQEGQERRQPGCEPPQAEAAEGGPSDGETVGSDHGVNEVVGQQTHQHGRGVGRVGPIIHAPAEESLLVILRKGQQFP